MNDGVYQHLIINHSLNFVDPTDSDKHTQNIEGIWMHAKRKLRYQFGTDENYFPEYLAEFM